jgi:hypothetical protein
MDSAPNSREYKAPEPWDPIRVKNAIDMELNFGSLTEGESESELTNSTPEAIAKDHARRSLPVAMDSIIYLATYSENETLRLKASTYLVDRVLGRITDTPIENIVDDTDPLTQLVKKAMGANAN